MKCNIPGTAREIIENLITIQGYSVKEIARMLEITEKTVYRIRKGHSPLPRIHLNLIQLFISLFHQKRRELEIN
jgi:predicted transcriptional regulator